MTDCSSSARVLDRALSAYLRATDQRTSLRASHGQQSVNSLTISVAMTVTMMTAITWRLPGRAACASLAGRSAAPARAGDARGELRGHSLRLQLSACRS